MERRQSRNDLPGLSQAERFLKSFSDRDIRFSAISEEGLLRQIDLLCDEQIAAWARGFVNGIPVQQLANESNVQRSQVVNGLNEAREAVLRAAEGTLTVAVAAPPVEEQAAILPPLSTVSDLASGKAEVRPLSNELNEDDATWRKKAACASKDPELFFPPDNKKADSAIRVAKAICARCEVKDACLSNALENNETFGIWGGLTESERRSLVRRSSLRRSP